jgi:DNA repair exonuclease SbcCD nuclease subunit
MIADMWINHFAIVDVLTGNHDELSFPFSMVNYLRYINKKDRYINVTGGSHITPPLRFGHYFIEKSKDSFGKYDYSTENFLKANKEAGVKYSLLGHQHDFQDMGDNCYHLGSVRYVNFKEDSKIKKCVAIHYDDRLEFIELSSVIPMFDVDSLVELEKIPNKAKVRYTYNSFEQAKDEVLKVNKIKNRFHIFKTKHNYTVQTTKRETAPKWTAIGWIRQLEDSDVKKLLLDEFRQEGLA